MEEIKSFETYEEAKKYLEDKAKEMGLEHYEIVEDTYEIPNGLLLIERGPENEFGDSDDLGPICLVAVEEWIKKESISEDIKESTHYVCMDEYGLDLEWFKNQKKAIQYAEEHSDVATVEEVTLYGNRIWDDTDTTVVWKRGGLPEDLDMAEIEMDDDMLLIRAIEQFLEEEEGEEDPVVIWSDGNYYVDETSGNEYLVCTYDEAEDMARERLTDYIESIGAVEYLGWEYVENYLDTDRFDQMMRDDIEDRVYNMDDDELIDEMESYNIISDEDRVSTLEDSDEEEFDEEDYLEYPESLLEDKKEELIDAICDSYHDGVEYFEGIFGSLKEFVEEDEDLIDKDSLVSDMLYDGFGNILASYDGEEHEIDYEDEYGTLKTVYLYRIN